MPHIAKLISEYGRTKPLTQGGGYLFHAKVAKISKMAVLSQPLKDLRVLCVKRNKVGTVSTLMKGGKT
jgi:hypothetical protein